jgi:hypothetical protein
LEVGLVHEWIGGLVELVTEANKARTRVRGGHSDSVENIDSLLDWRRVPAKWSKPATWRNQAPNMREQEAFQFV